MESEYKYKTEILKEVDFEFKKEVEVILTINQELEEVFTRSVNYINEKRTEHLNTFQPEIDEEEVNVEKNPKVKSLYRIIAKATHPDKKNDESLTEIYLEATKAYENNQILPIISICDKLKIPFEIDQDDFENIKTEIENIKKRTSFLETTYTWKWYTTNDVIKRSEIVLNFIKAQII